MTVAIDDERLLRAGDPSGMLDAFASIGTALERSYGSARDGTVPPVRDARSVTFCAMGGSAAAGDLVAAAFAHRVGVPMLTHRGHDVPLSYGPNDVVVCVSYSGDTEETVSAHDSAVARGCPVVAVCGGGLLAERADASGTPVVPIPVDAPVPRAGLGTLVGGVVGTLVAAELLASPDEDVASAGATLASLADELSPGVPADRNEAKAVAAWVGDRVPVVWGSEGVSAPAALRWKAAFNENAEVPAFRGVLPELSHHEIVGWTRGHGSPFCLLVLREPGEHATVPRRLEATLAEVEGSGLRWREVWARGEEPLARGLSLALVGDLAATYHALSRGVDPAAMDALVRVKERLGRGT
ncbi:MAG: SIS domain-containing protein [Actinomycetota bacterium]